LATTDHASRRPPQGAGRHRIRRRVGRQCRGHRGLRGSLIPHAGPIGALVIAMIEPAFGTGAMAATGRAHRAATGRTPTRGRAIRMAPITRGADREGPAAAPTGLESQRSVHVVGASTPPDWTATANRATTRRSARSVAASRRSRGPGGINSRSSPLVAADSLLHRPPSAGRSAAGCGPHRGRHHRRRTPVDPSTTAEPYRSNDREPRPQPDTRPELRASTRPLTQLDRRPSRPHSRGARGGGPPSGAATQGAAPHPGAPGRVGRTPPSATGTEGQTRSGHPAGRTTREDAHAADAALPHTACSRSVQGPPPLQYQGS
jgi:hypothetical protein